MPSLFLPATMASKLSPGYRLPEPLRKHQIQGATGCQLVADKMTVFVQALTINGFTVGYLILQVRQPVNWQFVSIGESGILHYLLNGNMHIRPFKATPMLQYSSQRYGMGYHPKGGKLALHFEQGEYHYFQLAFSVNLLQQLLYAFPILSFTPLPLYPCFSTFLPITKKVNDLVQLLLLQTGRAIPDVLQMNNYGLQLTARFLYDYKVQEKRAHWEQKKNVRFAELEAYINDHLDTDNRALVSTLVLARKTGTSPHHFKKLFRQQYGYSPAVFTRQKRMEKAMELITRSSLPAGDIYQQVGYEDFSSFTRSFTAYYGHPPTYYRPT